MTAHQRSAPFPFGSVGGADAPNWLIVATGREHLQETLFYPRAGFLLINSLLLKHDHTEAEFLSAGDSGEIFAWCGVEPFRLVLMELMTYSFFQVPASFEQISWMGKPTGS